MFRTLPTQAKKNWQEWVTTLTHAYNCTVSSVTGFSPYFLMFGWTQKITLDIEMGVMLTEQGDARKQKARLEWAYQMVHENNQNESECHKKYYEKRMRCIGLKPDDLVLVHVKTPSWDHKIADQWEETPHQVLSQLADQLVFQVEPGDAVND